MNDTGSCNEIKVEADAAEREIEKMIDASENTRVTVEEYVASIFLLCSLLHLLFKN